MTSIEAGPYELVKNEKGIYEKITYCIMDDNSISKRIYNKQGNVMTQEKLPQVDLTTALSQMD